MPNFSARIGGYPVSILDQNKLHTRMGRKERISPLMALRRRASKRSKEEMVQVMVILTFIMVHTETANEYLYGTLGQYKLGSRLG